MDLFFKDCARGLNVSWEDLLERLALPRHYTSICANDDYFSIVEHIIVSLLCNRGIVLLDHDMSAEERALVLNDQNLLVEDGTVELPRFTTKQELQAALCTDHEGWTITLFTSGTTGRPKRVSHSFRSISRAVRHSDKHAHDLWALAYNPTHMAGIQVILQALLNANSVVRVFGLDPATAVEQIRENAVTNISATPTFYRLLLGQQCVCPSVLRLTSGGEAFDAATIKRLLQLFPNAKITNVYASTEFGALFAAEGRDFVVKQTLREKVRIEEQELLVHTTLLGESMVIDGEWYHTGDLVEIVHEEPLTLRFVSRKSDMINVGGYKVNPAEVEDSLRSHEFVREARVYAKSNSVVGSIVCAEVVRASESLNETELRAFLAERLQEFKLPRMIKFVSELDTTRSGKLKRM